MAKKILIVDDEKDILAVAGQRVQNWGYEVVAVESAEAALKYLESARPDLILLDLLLPNLQGEEFCKKIKADPRYKDIPVILFTASASDIPAVAKEVGADDYIMKPFEPPELLDKIRRFLA